MNKMICIYHGNCADGFGAAWVVNRALGKVDCGIEFVAGMYGEAPPDVTGRDVIMVDFSYKRDVLLQMAVKANTILILDHHKTAAADLVDLPTNICAVFDMNHSGAMLTWMHFFKDMEPPQLLRHIEDRDLWKFQLPKTREIQAALFSYPYDFNVWDGLVEITEHEPMQLAREGEAIERKHFKDIAELLKVVQRRMNIGGYNVPVANLPYTFSSDAGHIMGKGEPFAACYYDTPKGRCFSLRSEPNGVDVSDVAKRFAGGGHKNAAGFTVPFDVAQRFEVEK